MDTNAHEWGGTVAVGEGRNHEWTRMRTNGEGNERGGTDEDGGCVDVGFAI